MKTLILISALLLALSASAQDNTQIVAKVVSAQNLAEIVRQDGQNSQALRRVEVSETDTLETDQNCFIQVRFLDGSILLLGCNSTLQIQQYQTDDVELHLLRGRMRTITGRGGIRRIFRGH